VRPRWRTPPVHVPQFELGNPAGVVARCLNQHWFLSLDDARQKMEEWRRDYNEVRPHSAIGNKPPISLMNAYGESGPP